ncbi:MAG: DNA-packaging protein, partial [Sphingomonadaceae bacterium]|nr:DNA-packaging protein [Sphingomonadaceae bacterium]
SALARAHPGASFALVAASMADARSLMIEGPSGLIAVARQGEERARLKWRPSLGRLIFANGAEAHIYSGAKADRLRGPQHHFAWCDELAKWKQAKETWDNLMLGLRCGERPRALVTTTPRPIAALKAIIGDPDAEVTGGTSFANPHLPRAHLAAMTRSYAGTRFGRQELEGEMMSEAAGALWTRKGIDGMRSGMGPGTPNTVSPVRTIVGVDPPASFEGTCGIVACGVDREGIAHVLADHSVSGASPEGWARKVAAAAAMWDARVVAEANNGGRMVETVLKGAGIKRPVRLVHAAEGKAARAAPIATLFESGQAKFAGRFPELEDELTGLAWGGSYEGPGSSPDRADAMVWAMTELMLGEERAEPRVRVL